MQHADSVVVTHRLSCSTKCEIFPDQGSNLCPLYGQVDSIPPGKSKLSDCITELDKNLQNPNEKIEFIKLLTKEQDQQELIHVGLNQLMRMIGIFYDLFETS